MKNEIMKALKFISIAAITFMLCIVKSFGQTSFPYRSVNSELIQSSFINLNLTGFTDATSYLPKGYVKDGTIDYTSFLQKAINENQKIVFPDFPILINDIGLQIPSSRVIFFKKNSKLLLKPTSKSEYSIISLVEVNNIIIYNPTIVGDRDAHLGTGGEWGMGISILGSSNIKLYNSKITSCWGDGIYLGVKKGGRINTNKNINIQSGWLDNNRRDAISIISGTKVNIKYLTLSNSNGVSPMSGIHIEPNNNNEAISDINISNVVTFNNRKSVGIANMHLIGGKQKDIEMSFNNIADYYSNLTPIHIGGHKQVYPKGTLSLGGNISFNNFKVYYPQKEKLILLDKYIDLMPSVTLKNVAVSDNGNKSTLSELRSKLVGNKKVSIN